MGVAVMIEIINMIEERWMGFNDFLPARFKSIVLYPSRRNSLEYSFVDFLLAMELWMSLVYKNR